MAKYGPDLYLYGRSGYRCRDCGFVFFHPTNRGNGGYPEEDWYECPRCGSFDYEEYNGMDYPDEDDIDE